ncbi:nuclear transport factor 2 family protein [Nocardioides sp. KR10-350]|uniref:nuclear transport factor 2 family protein n=1 Tax=Nocardioides cheoyonin TaxID=3156615 RepID=UPI0032B328A9
MPTTREVPSTVTRWHEAAAGQDPAALDDLLAEDAVFHSPAVHTPQRGKAITTAYLSAAFAVLGPTLEYHREWYADGSAVLEFTADLDGTFVQGVDMFEWGPDGRITDFTVMVRPVKGLQALMALMASRLQVS